MTHFKKLYDDYGAYNLLYNQLNMPSPSIEYAWRRTKTLLHNETKKCILKLLQKQEKVVVGDIGCGNGAFLIRLAQELNDKRVSYKGFDISKPFVEFANTAAKDKKLTNVTFEEIDFEHDKVHNSFNILVSSEVLEHVEDPQMFLKNVCDMLVKNGYFFLSTPNSNNLIKYPLFFLKKRISEYHEDEIKRSLTKEEEKFRLSDHEQHLFVFSHSQLKKSLSDVGLTVYRTPRSTTFFGGAFLDNKPLLFAASLMFDSLCNLLPLPQLGWDNIFFSQKS